MRTTALDPHHNYIFGFHPHGVLAAGAFANFCTEATGFGGLFPGLRPHLLTLPCWFRLPFIRDYMMAGGKLGDPHPPKKTGGALGCWAPVREGFGVLGTSLGRFWGAWEWLWHPAP